MPDAEAAAVLLIAHGSRRAEANADLVTLAAMLREHGEYSMVEPSYLEIAEPTIPQGAAACLAAGATRVLMLPFFLSAGAHVVEDLERHRHELAEDPATADLDRARRTGLPARFGSRGLLPAARRHQPSLTKAGHRKRIPTAVDTRCRSVRLRLGARYAGLRRPNPLP